MKAISIAVSALIPVLVPALLLVTASAEAVNVYDALKNCSHQQDNGKRVVCYDRVVAALDLNREIPLPAAVAAVAVPAAPAAIAATAITPTTVAPTQAEQKAAFGMEHKAVVNKHLDALVVSIKKLKKSLRGKWIITLENDQVWKQFDDSRLQIKAGQQVTIERGALSAFYLTRQGSNRKMRIKRSL